MRTLLRFPSDLRRLARFGAHGVCALALSACALPPTAGPGDADSPQPLAAKRTPAANRPATARSGLSAHAQAGASDERGSGWNLFSWGNDDSAANGSNGGDAGLGRQGSLDGLRADLGTFEERGSASWYGRGLHGRRTATGERFDMRAMTAAHPSLPLDSWVLVRNLRNDKVAVLRINDRGPYHGNRILDVSYAAAKRLGFVDHGATQVEIRRLSRTEVAALGPQAGVDNSVADEAGGDADDADADTTTRTKHSRAARKTSKTRKAAPRHKAR